MSEMKSASRAVKAYAEREKRVNDAIAMKVPDRIPFQLFAGFFPGRYCGIPFSCVYYDSPKWREANIKTITELEPDVYWAEGAALSGKALEILSPFQIRWPGFNVPPNLSHQMVELEPMKAEDYEDFLNDPSDYIVRTYLSRVMESAEPMAKLPPLQSLSLGPWGVAPFLAHFTQSDMVEMLEKFRRAAKLQAEWQKRHGSLDEEMAALGFPAYTTPRMMAPAPFDMISDFLRGMRGAMLDMYRRPDKLMEACDMLCRQTLKMIKASPTPEDGSVKRVFMALHRGSDGFMSLPQFETFYWPTLKKVLVALIEAGWTPCPFFEGTWDQRLEYLLELPRGKVLCHFAKTDPKKAKAVLGGRLCFMIDVPGSLLKTGTVPEVENHCRNLIDICGRDGGFIMTATCLDEASPENVKAMINTAKSYGRYA